MNAVTNESRPALARGVRLRTDPLNGEPVLLYPEGFLPLDSTSHDILIRCDGERTVAAIVEDLSAEYEADPDELRADVVEYIVQLRNEMLLT